MEQARMARIAEGDREAFRALYDDYFDYALRTANLVTRNAEAAKDAVQEAFLRVYRHSGQYDPAKPFKPWFYCILLRECCRVIEKEKKTVPYGERLDHIGTEQRFPEAETDIYAALQALDDKYRVPFILKYLHDYSEKEIADILELNVNTLKSRLLKGREKMRKSLGGTFYGSEA
ncbi:RNA polymerase sigma factor [Paenibacillus vietnamensis]|uniref:RNA polymerase sigma factor n=1 Tax=Paenibacillus vietnamensis TaxID=2590547 RepID=UPI001CD16FD7|nr:RNA polymerase sigma factor [Paenibacillus vietnamensis]